MSFGDHLIVADVQRIAPLILCLIAGAGCGDKDAGPEDSAPLTASVEVRNDFFLSAANGSTDPSIDTVAANGTVTWTWTEVGDHGLVFDDPALPSSDILFELGSNHTVVFTARGTFPYHCSVHQARMRGTVVVR